MHDWKSTAAGILSFLIATFTTITAFLAPYMMTAPAGEAALLAKVSAGCTLGVALARTYVGLITKNADAGAVAVALQAPTGSAASVPSVAVLTATPDAQVPNVASKL